MPVKPRKVWRDTEEKRALQLLAGAPHGCTQKVLRAHGFKATLLARIVRAGFAVAMPEIVKAGGRTLRLLRLTITDAGRREIACSPVVAEVEPPHGPGRGGRSSRVANL
jgi:hypothetical protein